MTEHTTPLMDPDAVWTRGRRRRTLRRGAIGFSAVALVALIGGGIYSQIDSAQQQVASGDEVTSTTALTNVVKCASGSTPFDLWVKPVDFAGVLGEVTRVDPGLYGNRQLAICSTMNGYALTPAQRVEAEARGVRVVDEYRLVSTASAGLDCRDQEGGPRLDRCPEFAMVSFGPVQPGPPASATPTEVAIELEADCQTWILKPIDGSGAIGPIGRTIC